MRFFRYPSIWIGLLLLVQAARAQVPTNLGGWQPNGTVLIENRATTHPKAPVRSGFLRVTRYEGSWVLRPIDAARTEVTTTGYADPAGVLPLAIVNMFVQQQPYLMLRNMKNVVQSPKYQRAQLYHLRNFTP